VRMPKVQIEEPLKVQNRSFLQAIESGKVDRSDAAFGAGVVRALEAVSEAMKGTGVGETAFRGDAPQQPRRKASVDRP